MTEQKQTYRIKGKTYSEEELKDFSKKMVKSDKTPKWEKEIYHFILDWISPLELLPVQTSGSTGLPKSLEIPKEFIEASAKASVNFMELEKGKVAFLCLPVQFIAGKLMVVRAFVGGLDLHYTEPSSLPDTSDIKEIEFAGMIPMQVTKMLESANGEEELKKIKKLIIGGSFVPSGLEARLRNFPNKIWATYGMTETITHVALRRLNGEEASEWYTPFPTVSLRMDERGCAVIDAPYIDVKGLVSNDIIKLGPDGKFKVLGRIDNVVMSGGLLLHPELIEKKIYAVIDNDFFVAGMHDHELGERLVLFVEDPEKKLAETNNELMDVVRERLTGYEVPKNIVFMEKFMRTGNGKILRANTVDEYVAQLNEQ